MHLFDNLRLGTALAAYDFWLSIDGVRARRRRELRADLRANLQEAAERGGMQAALRRLGSTRRLAVETVPGRDDRPRWLLGLFAWELTFGLMFWSLLISVATFADGAEAAGAVNRRVEGAITFLPGTTASYEKTATGISFGGTIGWFPVVLPIVVGLLVAKPWRLWTRRSTRLSAASA